MSAVAHGGDAGADPPGGPWDPPSSHITKQKVRGPTTAKNLQEAFRKNDYKPLDVDFDFLGRPVNPIGDEGQWMITLIGTLVGDIKFPKYYLDWEKVPREAKTRIWPEIQTFFDMSRHLNGPKSQEIVAGIDAICARRYSDRKSNFKNKWFVKRNGYERAAEIRSEPPPDMEATEWNKFVDYCLSDKVKKISVEYRLSFKNEIYKSSRD